MPQSEKREHESSGLASEKGVVTDRSENPAQIAAGVGKNMEQTPDLEPAPVRTVDQARKWTAEEKNETREGGEQAAAQRVAAV